MIELNPQTKPSQFQDLNQQDDKISIQQYYSTNQVLESQKQINKSHNERFSQLQINQQNKESFANKKTIISSTVVDKKQIKQFLGKAVTFNQGISSYSSFRPNKVSQDFFQHKNCKQKLELFFKKYIIIKPTSIFRIVWDFLSIIAILFSCFYNAYKISFDSSKNTDYNWYEILVECFFVTDIILNFFSAYYNPEDDEVVYDMKLIALRYITQGYFFLDFISTFPWQLVNKNITVVKLLRMLRLPRFLKLVKEDRFINVVNTVLRYSDTSDKVKTQFIFRYIYRNIQFILTGLSLAYFVSCLWYYMVASVDDQNMEGKTFITQYGIQYMPDWKKAVTNCYFVLTTFATVGFGDLTPQTNNERIFVIFMMVCGIAFFSFIMNNFNDVLTNYWKKLGYVDRKIEIEEWILSLSNYTERSIDKKLVNQIQNHFDYFYRNSRLSVISRRDKYFQLMPQDLKREMIKHLFQDIFYTKFRSLFLLNGKFECSDYGFYIDTAFQLIPMKYCQGDIICKQGDKFSEVYLVQQGEIEATFTLDDIKVSRFFSSGFYFGAVNILSNKLCAVDFKASKNVKLLVWSRNNFLETINRYKEMKEHIISVCFQSFKTMKNSMLQALVQQVKVKKGTNISEDAAQRIFRNMLKFVYSQKRKQQYAQEQGVAFATQATVGYDLIEVEKRFNKVKNCINEIDPTIDEKKQQKKQNFENQQQQLKSLIRTLDRQN
ncbi:hypothetical protein ABPG72_005526 [Tetrahymena utriculariae]